MSDELLEALSELEHDQWTIWARNLIQSENNLSDSRLERWNKLLAKTYSQLSEDEKEQDRIWARRVIEIIERTKL